MYSFFTKEGLANLEFNHRLFCYTNDIPFTKIHVSNSIAEKYSIILAKLQENVGETLIFLDCHSFIKYMNVSLDLDRDITVQKHKGIINDNLIIVKSNQKTISIFGSLLHSINKQIFLKERWPSVQLEFPEEYIVDYEFREKKNVYLNINAISNPEVLDKNFQNVFVVNTFNQTQQSFNTPYFAESLCTKEGPSLVEKEEKFECFNEGKKTGFVSLFTPEIKEIGMIAEENLKLFCKRNDITLYMYRDLTDYLKEKSISGAWCKPWLLLENFDKHENIFWVDSDIIFGKDCKIDISKEILTFSDPWYPMNSGFMGFKTTKKNKDLINSVIQEFFKIDGTLEGVYNHGGDQPIFTRKIEEFYPENVHCSPLFGNTHPSYPIPPSPYKDDVMIHFMGYEKRFRTHLMRKYSQIINSRY